MTARTEKELNDAWLDQQLRDNTRRTRAVPDKPERRVCGHCGLLEADDRWTGRRLYCDRFDDIGCGKAYDPELALETLRSIKGGAFGTKNSSSPTIEKFWRTGDPEDIGTKKSDQPPMFD